MTQPVDPRARFRADDIAAANARLNGAEPAEIVAWALAAAAPATAVVSTNFRPYEAVLLHLCTSAQPDLPVLWADHGYNRPATYRHVAVLEAQLHLNLHAFVPRRTAAHRDAVEGPLPEPDDEAGLRRFSAEFKLEPFRRGLQTLAPAVWFTALRRAQSPERAGTDVVAFDETFGVVKVCPVLHWSDAEMEAYLQAHGLPNEWDYWDPAKADEKRECGLHAHWAKEHGAKKTERFV
ncbi:MAG: phosphoadenosine phosphosulfate reductase family protein [Myxococcota bacterium]